MGIFMHVKSHWCPMTTTSPSTDTWLIDPSVDASAQGLSNALNEGAPDLTHSIFHYTTETGLDGVLRTGELWGTSITFMDDPGEVELSWKLISDITSTWTGRSWDYDRIVRQIPTTFGSDLFRERFVISFCSEPDYLLAWRAYAGDSQGYCLEFSPAGLKGQDGWYLAKVEYSEEEHRKEIHRVLKRLEQAYVSVEHTIHQQFLTERIFASVAMWLSLLAPTFKNRQYSSEQEWRLVRTQFGEDEKLPLIVAERLRSGEAVPYVARPIGVSEGTASNLVRILCGARVSEKTVDDVRRLVHTRFPWVQRREVQASVSPPSIAVSYHRCSLTPSVKLRANHIKCERSELH
jgi:hypothetical protein